jgi:Coenzyme PQQ synthesis protein D (PqqD)
MSTARIGYNEPNVLYERFDEEVVAVHLGTGVYHSMLGSAGDIFIWLGGAPTRDELVAALLAKYDAPIDVITADLDQFLKGLKEEGLIREIAPHNNESASRFSVETPASRMPYAAPVLDAHRELEKLFLLDPVHDTAEAGWPHAKPADAHNARRGYRLNADHCVLEKFEEATIALHVATGAYFSFAGIAEDALSLLHEAPTIEELASALAGKYAASEVDLQNALTPFLARLVQARLVVQEPGDDHAPIRSLALPHTGERLEVSNLDFETFRDAAATPVGTPETQAELSILSGNKRFRLVTDQATYALVDDGGLVVHLARGEYFILNATCAHVFRLLETGATVSEIASFLRRRYDVKRSEVVAAVVILLRSLTALQLVAIGEDPPRVAAQLTSDAALIEPFEPFSIDIRTDLRETMCLYPDGTRVQPAPAAPGQQMSSLLGDYFAHAAESHPVVDSFVEIAGRRVRIRCIGEERSRELNRAFSHLAVPMPAGKTPDLTIHVWDSSVAGPSNSALLNFYLQDLYAKWVEHCGPRGELKGFHSPAVPTFYAPGPDVLNLIDLQAGHAFFLQRTDDPLPYWETGSPFRTILHAWLSPMGLQFIHGAGLGENGRGAILAGKGGSGKSTTALLCLNAGLQYAGDDYCIVARAPDARVHSLYNTVKLRPEDLERFPNLRRHLVNPQSLQPGRTDKSTFFLSDLRPDLLARDFPVHALLLPRVTRAPRTTVTECGPTEALAAIAPSTMAQLPDAGPVDMARISALIASLPCYALNLGTTLEEIPDVVRRVLHG